MGYSTRWRILAGVTTSPWKVRAVRFYEDPRCMQLLPTVPQGWPRHPRQARGAPFASPSVERHLHEVCKPGAGTTRADDWYNGSQLSGDPNWTVVVFGCTLHRLK